MKALVQNSIIQVKHNLYEKMHQAKAFWSQNWLKLIVIAFAVLIVCIKDINVSMNLASAGAAFPSSNAAYLSPINDNEDKPEVKPTSWHSKPSKPNPANTFSNLGFVLNPTYAKRKKVPQKVVDFHNNKCLDYIQKYASVAQQEMRKYGIPASVKLAQGLLESNAGASKLAMNNNNHFGIKCFSRKCKKGHCSNFTDDSHKDFFRKYDSAWESYRAHSQFLQKDRYKHLKKIGTSDYEAWAYGLKEAGYATDPKYASKIVRIIEKLDLHRFDD